MVVMMVETRVFFCKKVEVAREYPEDGRKCAFSGVSIA